MLGGLFQGGDPHDVLPIPFLLPRPFSPQRVGTLADPEPPSTGRCLVPAWSETAVGGGGCALPAALQPGPSLPCPPPARPRSPRLLQRRQSAPVAPPTCQVASPLLPLLPRGHPQNGAAPWAWRAPRSSFQSLPSPSSTQRGEKKESKVTAQGSSEWSPLLEHFQKYFIRIGPPINLES